MDKESVEKKIKRMIKEKLSLNLELEQIPSNENVVERFNLNSIDVLELLIGIETEFNIEIEDEDLNAELVESLSNLANYVMKKINRDNLPIS